MAFDNMDMEEVESDLKESPPPEESGNRAFLIAAGVLGAIAILALICIAVYAFVILPRRPDRADQVATLDAQNTQVAMAITQTSGAAAATFTPTVTPVPNTATPTPTMVVAVATATRIPTQDPRTATVAALLTQAAITTQTVVPTATALPQTGFAEDVGLPALLGIGVLLIAVIFLSRRLRSA
jgi:LPXTG-motif cell wall-anchored protein